MTTQETLISITGVQYKKLARLGEGQFGKVYKIVDSSGNLFALKELDFTN